MHKTPTRGPGNKSKVTAKRKPNSDIKLPMVEERTIAIQRLGACVNPNKGGAESKPITRITPTEAIALTMTRAVEKPKATLKVDTFIPLVAALSGSNPICTSC